MSYTEYHPAVHDAVHLATTIQDHFIEELERDDMKRVRSRHKSSIQKLREIRNRYALEAAVNGMDVETAEVTPPETQGNGFIRNFLAEAVVFLFFVLGLYALYLLAWGITG